MKSFEHDVWKKMYIYKFDKKRGICEESSGAKYDMGKIVQSDKLQKWTMSIQNFRYKV